MNKLNELQKLIKEAYSFEDEVHELRTAAWAHFNKENIIPGQDDIVEFIADAHKKRTGKTLGEVDYGIIRNMVGASKPAEEEKEKK